MQKRKHLTRLLMGGAFVCAFPAFVHAEGQEVVNPYTSGTGGYVDATDRDLNRTANRARDTEQGIEVGDVKIPGYNPNMLRPAGDGLGAHVATDTLNMAGNDLRNVRNIVGTGATIITGISLPMNASDAANKFYVDEIVAQATAEIEDQISTGDGNVNGRIDNLSGGDGITRIGDEFNVDNTVVRTFGDQAIAGVKNFSTRVNISTSGNRPLDSRSGAVGGVGVYGRSTSAGAGRGVFGLADGTEGIGVNGYSTGAGSTGVRGDASGASSAAGAFYSLNPTGAALIASVTDRSGKNLLLFSAGSELIGAVLSNENGIRIVGVVNPETADEVTNKGYVDAMIAGAIAGLGTPTLSEVLESGNSADGIIITGLPLPVGATDATSKGYVDTSIAAAIGGLTDPTLAEVLAMGNNAGNIQITGLPMPVGLTDATSKGYVDARVAEAVQGLSGDQGLTSVLTVSNDAGGLRITSLALPTLVSDAATKGYVDTSIATAVAGLADPTLAEVLAAGNNANQIMITGLPRPLETSDAANKGYVDARVDNAIVGLTGDQGLASVLTVSNSAGGLRITTLAAPTAGSDAATKAYVDTAIAGIDVAGGADNLGNHTATRNLAMAGFDISNVRLISGSHADGTTMVLGRYVPTSDFSLHAWGTGTVNGRVATLINDATMNNWVITTHVNGASETAAMNLDFAARTLYVYGQPVLTTQNISTQQINFNNDRDGYYDASTATNVYTTAIQSQVNGNIAASFIFHARGMNSTGLIGFAHGQDSRGLIVDAVENGFIGIEARVSRASAGTTKAQRAIWAYAASTAVPGSVGLLAGSQATDGVAAHIDVSGNSSALMRFSRNEGIVGGMDWSSNTLVLNMGDAASNRTGRVIGLRTPTVGNEAANKAYVDSAIAAIPAGGGGADNLGNHTATRALAMSGFGITGARSLQVSKGSGALVTGPNAPYVDTNIMLTGSPGTDAPAATQYTQYINANDVGSWRVRFHADGDGFENGLNLRHAERDLWVFGHKVLTTANLSDQQLNFDNDRPGRVEQGWALYTSAISSNANAFISSSLSFNARGERSAGVMGWAHGEESAAAKFFSAHPNTTGLQVQAQAPGIGRVYTESTNTMSPQYGLKAGNILGSIPGSVGATIYSEVENGTALQVKASNDTLTLLNFFSGNTSIGYFHRTGGRLSLEMLNGAINFNSTGSASRVNITRSTTDYNASISYNTDAGSVYAGQGDAGWFAVASGTDMRWSQTGRVQFNANTGDMRWRGTATGTVAAPSDARLKTNVATIENPMELLSKVRPVSYDLIDGGKKNWGVIAQELEAVYPEMVNSGEDGMRSVEYVQLIAPMLAAIQQMEHRITELEAELAAR